MAGSKKSKELLSLLFKFCYGMLKKHNINFIPFYGTLLGIIRENDFIEKDDDIDVLIDYNDYQKVLKMIKVEKIKTRKVKNNFIQLCLPSGEGPIDIYFYNKLSKDIVIGWEKNSLYSINDIFPLKKMIFKDKEITIPINANKILKIIYGDNYLTPLGKESFPKNFVGTNRMRFLPKPPLFTPVKRRSFKQDVKMQFL